MTQTISQHAQIQELVSDLDQLVGVDGNFWEGRKAQSHDLSTPHQLRDFCRDILVDVFGLEVQGL